MFTFESNKFNFKFSFVLAGDHSIDWLSSAWCAIRKQMIATQQMCPANLFIFSSSIRMKLAK